MTHDRLFLFALFAGVFAALFWGRWRYDLIAFSALLIAAVAGLVPAGKAFGGFGHPATLVMALVRDRKRRYAVSRDRAIEAVDVILVEGPAEAMDELRAGLKPDFADQRRKSCLSAEKAGYELTEAVVPADARIGGKTTEAVGPIWRQRAVLLGTSRRGQRIRGPLRKTRIRAGDILLLLPPGDTSAAVIDWLGCLPLADQGVAMTRAHGPWPRWASASPPSPPPALA